MKTQKEIFKAGEGDRWFFRNKKSSNSWRDGEDKIVNLIKAIKLFPKKVLEIGCSNGHRLEAIRNAFKAECYGIDPASKAISDGKEQISKNFATNRHGRSAAF